MLNDTNLLLDLIAIMLTVAYLFKLVLEESSGSGLSIRQRLWAVCRTTKRSLIGQHVAARAGGLKIVAR